MLKIENLSFSYGDRVLLKEITLHLLAGESLSILGLSGSGKTTLLRLIAGLLPVTYGSLAVQEKPALMPQEDLLLPWRTVLENIMLPAELGSNPACRRDQALDLLAEVGLEQQAHFYPDQLSGGMRQRTALARSLLLEKNFLLLDEPFASLDVATREDMYVLIKRLKQKRKLTLCMVTHDFQDAASLSDRILLLHQHSIVKDWLVNQDVNAIRTELLSILRSGK